MKRKIVVLTNFSASSRRAAEVSVGLAERIGAEILLFHACPPVPFIPSTEDVDWVCLEEYGNYAPESAARLRAEAEALIKQHGGDHLPQISYRNDLGALQDVAARLEEDGMADLLVMGKTNKPYRNLFFGSDTRDLIHRTGCPVLIVPDAPGFFQLQNLVFATDLASDDLVALQHMDQLFAGLGLSVAVCHVYTPFQLAYSRNDRVARFRQEAARLKNMNVSFHQLLGESVTAELSLFADKMHADGMVFSRKHHSRLAELLHTGELLEDQLVSTSRLPVLVLPSASRAPRHE